jgi:hypothetical protein
VEAPNQSPRGRVPSVHSASGGFNWPESDRANTACSPYEPPCNGIHEPNNIQSHPANHQDPPIVGTAAHDTLGHPFIRGCMVLKLPTIRIPTTAGALTPPPVDTWDSLSSVPHLAAHVAVSPPPMTDTAPRAVAATTASITALVPLSAQAEHRQSTGRAQAEHRQSTGRAQAEHREVISTPAHRGTQGRTLGSATRGGGGGTKSVVRKRHAQPPFDTRTHTHTRTRTHTRTHTYTHMHTRTGELMHTQMHRTHTCTCKHEHTTLMQCVNQSMTYRSLPTLWSPATATERPKPTKGGKCGWWRGIVMQAGGSVGKGKGKGERGRE